MAEPMTNERLAEIERRLHRDGHFFPAHFVMPDLIDEIRRLRAELAARPAIWNEGFEAGRSSTISVNAFRQYSRNPYTETP